MINIQAGGRACVTVESHQPLRMQNSGQRRSGGRRWAAQADGPTAYFATIPVNAHGSERPWCGLPCHVSSAAGTYVCNCVMYSDVLTFAQQNIRISMGFIHVPFACGR